MKTVIIGLGIFLLFAAGGAMAGDPGEVSSAGAAPAEVGDTTPASSDGGAPAPEIDLRLRNLEEKINSLKDKVFRAKQRLAVLQETVLSGALAGARCSIIHRYEVGTAFELVSVLYYLDEAPVFKWVEGGPEIKNEVSIFDGSVVPGPHHLSIYLVYRGKGYGLFSYMKGYLFKLKAGYSFNVEEGQLVEVTATTLDRGSLVKLDNRLYLSFDIAKKSHEESTTAERNDRRQERPAQ